MSDIPLIQIEELDDDIDEDGEIAKVNKDVSTSENIRPKILKASDVISEANRMIASREKLCITSGNILPSNEDDYSKKPVIAERIRRSLIPLEFKSSNIPFGSPGVNRRNSVATGNILKKIAKKGGDDNVRRSTKRLSLDSMFSRKPKLTELLRKRYSVLKPEPESGSALLNVLSHTRQRSARPRTPRKPKIPPLLRFRSYVRIALICVRLCKYSHENVAASQSEYLSIIQVTEDYVTHTPGSDGLYFDPTVYVADKEQRLPVDARRILQKSSRLRTRKDIEYLHLVLRSIKAFADYPNVMQKKLCEEGWYEAYESKRAIVRQGQPPHAFYFILSGSVVVTSYDKAGGTTFLVSLHKGMSFGELAVITRSKRQATVSTSNPTEFLCISAKDFVEIFMSGGIKSVTDPEHNSFIRSIPFLKHWPIECLASHPQACMFHYFGRGQVLVRDSNHSDWIYIVKSGSLSVLKKLVEVHPRVQARQESKAESDVDWGDSSPKSKHFGTWNFRIKKKKRVHTSEEKEVFKNNIEMEKRLEQILPGFYNATERLGLIDYDEIITDHKTRILPSNRKTSTAESNTLPTITIQSLESPHEDTKTEEDDSVMDPAEEEKAIKLPKIRKTSKRVIWKDPEVGSVKTMSPDDKYPNDPVMKFPKGAYLASTKKSKRKFTRKEAIQEEIFQKQQEYDQKAQDKQKIGRKTIADELDNKMIKDFTLTEKDIRPMFVQVQILERGQYFGLTKTVFPEQAESFSVVSNGAECIMISKRFFFEKANETVMYHLRQVETLLPQEEELQASLQDFVDWKAHRARVYNRLVKNKQSRTVRHQQFPTQYGGQYCFRTGPTVRID